MEPPTYLANLNPHPRDSHISFDEGPHIYTIDGDSDYMSVTTWNHSHFPHFNPFHRKNRTNPSFLVTYLRALRQEFPFPPRGTSIRVSVF